MPIAFAVCAEQRTVTLTFTGLINVADLGAANQDLYADFGGKGYRALMDLREANLDLTTIDLWRATALPPAFETVAVVVANDVGFGLARTFEMLSEGSRTVSVFRSVEAAKEWLAKAPGSEEEEN